MPQSERPPSSGVGAIVALSIVAGLFCLFAVASASNLAGSDPAGNALAQAYTAFIVMALWLLLAVTAIVAAKKGTSPKWALVAAAVLIPASGFAAIVALELLSRPHQPPYRWPLILPALVPPLVVVFCLWAVIPALRRTPFVPVVTWGAVALLCLAMVPLTHIRAGVVADFQEAREKYARDFAAMPSDAPLGEWLRFLDTPDQTRVQAVVDKIRALDSRQRDAETMLERGDFPLGYLGRFDLTPNASLCEKARGQLRREAAAHMATIPGKPYREIAAAVDDATTAINWLVGYGCACDAEITAWENTIKDYANPNYDVHRLRDLRDPKALGRIVRENPERFTMLNDTSHLKAWLRFAEDRALRDQALAGARKIDHRTADAVEMLADTYDFSVPWQVIRFLPALDLEPTPALCSAAVGHIRAETKKVYRPSPDSPRPYSEFLGRLSYGGAQLPALQWLAAHGCDAEAALTETQALIMTYQDSPERAAMLASLQGLHRR